jgi:hypothetical protein
MLDFYLEKYTRGSIFNVLRSLCYFDDAEAIPMPDMLIPTRWENVKSAIKHLTEQYAR